MQFQLFFKLGNVFLQTYVVSNGEMKYLTESAREDATKEERVNETAGNIQ